jgi:hypothetical protein
MEPASTSSVSFMRERPTVTELHHEDGPFYRNFNKLLLVVAASAFGGGAIRIGTSPLTDEVTKLREVMAMVVSRVDNIELREARRDVQVQDHERRIGAIEILKTRLPTKGTK